MYFKYICKTNQNRDDSENKYYYLSLKHDKKKDNNWSIHGLWPHYSQTEYPSYCKKVDFDINKLDPIIEDLNNYWYSSKEKNDLFWKHEWEKHGSCMFTNMDELDYFKTALKLFIDSVQSDSINKFKVSENRSLIPIGIDLKIINDDIITDEID